MQRQIGWQIGRRAVLAGLVLGPLAARAADGFVFDSIDGGQYALEEWRGRPVLVVNTASMCGFAPQFTELQALQDRYGDRLVVLAVPSDDFRQELGTAAEVKEYCQANFNITLRMTGITHVKGPGAHPLYRWLADDHGFVPGWNFNKVLLGPDGVPRGFWGAPVKPASAAITGAIDAALG